MHNWYSCIVCACVLFNFTLQFTDHDSGSVSILCFHFSLSVCRLKSSQACGPFSNYNTSWEALPAAVEALPQNAKNFINLLGSETFAVSFFVVTWWVVGVVFYTLIDILFVFLAELKNVGVFSYSFYSLAMFYVIALAGAHKKVINQLREKLVMVCQLDSLQSEGWPVKNPCTEIFPGFCFTGGPGQTLPDPEAVSGPECPSGQIHTAAPQSQQAEPQLPHQLLQQLQRCGGPGAFSTTLLHTCVRHGEDIPQVDKHTGVEPTTKKIQFLHCFYFSYINFFRLFCFSVLTLKLVCFCKYASILSVFSVFLMTYVYM